MTTESLRVEAADLGRPPSRTATWLRRHPVVVDVVVVVTVGVPHLLMLLLWGATTWWSYLLLAVPAGALLARHRRPFTVLLVIAVACALSELTQPDLPVPTLSFAFALYTVASRETMVRALVGWGAAVAVTVLATIPETLQGIRPDLVSLTDPTSVLAFVAGILVKSRRDRTRWLTETVNQRIENAALTERTRIAAEMHDLVAHSLTVIVSLANGATSAAQKHPERSRAAVEQIAAVGRDALGDMHRTLALLRDADAGLDANLHRSGGNLPTLEELAEGFRVAGLPVTLTRTGPALPDDAALRQAVYRIVQESLTNSLRHANGPTGATVTIDHGGGAVVLTITDDGGPVTRPGPPGHGLVGIRQRATAHGGEAEAGPRPGGGWRTRVVLGTGGTRDEGDRTDSGDRTEGGDRGDG